MEDIEVVEKRSAIIEKNLPAELLNDIDNPNNVQKIRDLIKIMDTNQEYHIFELGYAFVGFDLIEYAKCCLEVLQETNPNGKFAKSLQKKIETYKPL